MHKLFRILATSATILVMLMSTALVTANGPINPDTVDETIHPGDSFTLDKFVTTSELPPKLDICLVIDLSGSYTDDLPNIKTLAPGIFDAVKAQVDDVQFGLASFVDFPFLNWGYQPAGDYAYQLEQDLTPIKATWTAAVSALSTRNGWDSPESQYEALYQVATGAGRDVPPAGSSLGDIAPNQQCTYREDATKVVILTTDAPFHNAGDGGGPFSYPGPSTATTTAALLTAGIKVIGLKAPGAGSELDALAISTGGSVQPTSSTSSDIAEAILAGLEELTTDVWWETNCGPEISVSLDPVVEYDVAGDTTVVFEETITVPNDTGPGVYTCTVTFIANEYPDEGAEIGTESIRIEVIPIPVPLDIKPTSCRNPLNVKEKGVILVAIPGTVDFDVNDVDPDTVRLEGVAPLWWAWEDVATPYEPWTGKEGAFDCTEEGADGYMDITFKFDAQEVIAALGDVDDGEVLTLYLTGNLFDGRAIIGEDVVVILEKGK